MDSPETLNHRIQLLGDALLKVLQADGMIRSDIQELSGPELLHMADSYCIALKESQQETLFVGDIVRRDDGRFYIPLYREPPYDDVSNIVARVASDAFAAPLHDGVSFA